MSLHLGAGLPQQFVARANAAVRVLAKRGIRVHASSRFPHYHRALERFHAGGVIDQTLFAQSVIELHQMTSIVEAFGDTEDAVLHQKLQTLASDCILPRDSRAESPGRDTQSELFLAAHFNEAGRKVLFEEPDFIVEVPGRFIGFSVKRPKSVKSLQKRLHDALGQAVRAVAAGEITHGILACDVSFLANPQGGFVVRKGRTGIGDDARAAVGRIALDLERGRVIERLLGGRDTRPCCAIVLFGVFPVIEIVECDGATRCMDAVTSWAVSVLRTDRRYSATVNAIRECFIDLGADEAPTLYPFDVRSL